MSVAHLSGVTGATRPPWQKPLVGAMSTALGLVMVYVCAFHAPAGPRLDTEGLISFWTLRREAVISVAKAMVDTVSPAAFCVAAVVLAVSAPRGRRLAFGVMIAVILAGPISTAEVLKSVTPQHSAVVRGWLVTAPGAYPSGHAAASLSLALGAVLVASGRARRIVAVLGTLYALTVGYSLLVIGLHYPSDVLGGYLIAGLWAFLAIAGGRASRAFGDEPSDVRFAGLDVLTPVAWTFAFTTAGLAISIIAVSPSRWALTLAIAAAVIGCLVVTIIVSVAGLSPCSDKRSARGLVRT